MGLLPQPSLAASDRLIKRSCSSATLVVRRTHRAFPVPFVLAPILADAALAAFDII